MKLIANGNVKTVLSLSILSLAFGACTSQESSQTAPSSAPSGSDRSEQYVQEVIRIKASTNSSQIVDKLSKLNQEFGIKSNEEAITPNVDLQQPEPGRALSKVAGTIATGSYSPKAIQQTTVSLNAGDVLEAYTTGVTGGTSTDPIMVLFKSTALPNGAKTDLGLNTVYAWSDDYAGLHPKITFTATESGNYILQVFPFRTTTQGPAKIYARRYRNGAWQAPFLNGNINVNGTIYTSSVGGANYMKTTSYTGSDPIIFVWNLSTLGASPSYASGVHNDDYWGYTTKNSNTANTAVYLGTGLYDVVLLGASPYFGTGGTATWEHWN